MVTKASICVIALACLVRTSLAKHPHQVEIVPRLALPIPNVVTTASASAGTPGAETLDARAPDGRHAAAVSKTAPHRRAPKSFTEYAAIKKDAARKRDVAPIAPWTYTGANLKTGFTITGLFQADKMCPTDVAPEWNYIDGIRGNETLTVGEIMDDLKANTASDIALHMATACQNATEAAYSSMKAFFGGVTPGLAPFYGEDSLLFLYNNHSVTLIPTLNSAGGLVYSIEATDPTNVTAVTTVKDPLALGVATGIFAISAFEALSTALTTSFVDGFAAKKDKTQGLTAQEAITVHYLIAALSYLTSIGTGLITELIANSTDGTPLAAPAKVASAAQADHFAAGKVGDALDPHVMIKAETVPTFLSTLQGCPTT